MQREARDNGSHYGRVGLLTLLRGGHGLGWETWEERGNKMGQRGNQESEERDELMCKRI